ncbi:MAG: sulfatase [Candidatus Binatia bacterium]|nr:sulfatase [Candidatus Binatia bacterium]
MPVRVLWPLLVLVVLGLGWFFWPPPAPPTNLVLIGIDTLRPDHASVYGYDKPTTPRLEALAARGVLFEEATSHAPWTLPSVSTVLTSLYPSQHGARVPGDLKDLTDDVPVRLGDVETLAQILRRSGKVTQAFVANAFTGYGIDDHFEGFSYAHASADRISRDGVDFLRANREHPFFLYLHYTDPHEHHRLLPKEHRARFTDASVLEAMGDRDKAGYRYIYDNFGPALYDAQTSFADEQVGVVFDALQQLDLTGRTLVVVFSDHGEEFWEHADAHRRYGEDPRGIYGLGHGQSLYQELLSVVFLMAGGDLPAGQVVKGAVGLRDLAPTVLDVMGLPPGTTMEGTSLVPAITSGQAPEREVFSESIAYGYEKKAIRVGDWKYILSLPDSLDELYDLRADPGETTNLAASDPERTAAMRRRVEEIVAGFAPEEPTEPTGISEETRRNLQALGYLTDDRAVPRDQP